MTKYFVSSTKHLVVVLLNLEVLFSTSPLRSLRLRRGGVTRSHPPISLQDFASNGGQPTFGPGKAAEYETCDNETTSAEFRMYPPSFHGIYNKLEVADGQLQTVNMIPSAVLASNECYMRETSLTRVNNKSSTHSALGCGGRQVIHHIWTRELSLSSVWVE